MQETHLMNAQSQFVERMAFPSRDMLAGFDVMTLTSLIGYLEWSEPERLFERRGYLL
jgi:hypothetical protein